jgi:hypothetical protein
MGGHDIIDMLCDFILCLMVKFNVIEWYFTKNRFLIILVLRLYMHCDFILYFIPLVCYSYSM